MYMFDTQKGQFKLLADPDSYTTSEMIWDYIEEYEMYNISIRDIAKFQMKKDPETGEDLLIETTIESTDKDNIPRTFDVTKNGEYLGMPRIEEFVA